jgi:hypothetical protein
MIKEFLTTVNLPDATAGALIAGTVVWFAKHPRGVIRFLSMLDKKNGNETLTVGRHGEICSAVLEPIKGDTAEIKAAMGIVANDVTWIKDSLGNLHRRLDERK